MSFWNTIEQDLAAIKRWFDGSPIGKAIEADFKACVDELSKVAASDVENAVKVIGLQVLAALATGGTSAAIAAGIAAAEIEFKAVGVDLSKRAVSTLVTTVVNQVQAQTTPAPVQPAA